MLKLREWNECSTLYRVEEFEGNKIESIVYDEVDFKSIYNFLYKQRCIEMEGRFIPPSNKNVYYSFERSNY